MSIIIAICDDEIAEVKYLAMVVNNWARLNNIIVTISTFNSAESFLFQYADDKSCDILLLDIQMNNMNGVELAKKVRSISETVQIVFITGYPDFIAEGYEVSALHYLMKPVNEQKLFDVLNKACRRLNKTEKALFLAVDGQNVRIPVNSIVYAESFAHIVEIMADGDIVKARISISELETRLGEGFIRCHRSYIVGVKYIKRITKNEVVLDNGKRIPLSRQLYNKVNQEFIRFFKETN